MVYNNVYIYIYNNFFYKYFQNIQNIDINIIIDRLYLKKKLFRILFSIIILYKIIKIEKKIAFLQFHTLVIKFFACNLKTENLSLVI